MKTSINILSSREKCIVKSLASIAKHYPSNNLNNINVYYFDNIYSDLIFRKSVRDLISSKVNFIKVPYKTPDFIEEKDLFYNLDNAYAKSFGVSRKGYLHMCNFISNIFTYKDSNILDDDFIMICDDEAGFLNKLPYDPCEILKNKNIHIGAFFVGQRLKNNKPHQGHLDTRINLWKTTKEFILKNSVTPKNKNLLKLLKDPNSENNFHYLEWCDTYVINTDMFKTELWNLWIKHINESGGVYKYRWGDNEIYTLYAHMTQEKIYKFDAIDKRYYDQGMFRRLQDIAPNVLDVRK